MSCLTHGVILSFVMMLLLRMRIYGAVCMMRVGVSSLPGHLTSDGRDGGAADCGLYSQCLSCRGAGCPSKRFLHTGMTGGIQGYGRGV